MKKIFETIWKSLLVGTAYTLALMIGGMIVDLAGLGLPEVEEPQNILMWTFVGGIIAGLFLGPVAALISASRMRHIVVWSCVLFFNLVCVAIEGYFFAPDLIGDSLMGLIVQQIFAAPATGWIVTVLFTSRETPAPIQPSSRSLASWSWRLLFSVLSFVVFYFVFGGINYALVTKPYYETHAGGLNVPTPDVVLVAELVRGVLIVVSLLPFFLTLHTERKRLILLTGLILFSVGGLVPLTMQVNALPLFLLVASAWEIAFMNFSTGSVMALLLGQSE